MAVASIVATIDHTDPELSGTFEFPPFAQVAFERERKKSLRSLETLEDIYYACWLATKHSGVTSLPPFDGWLKGLRGADIGSDDTPLD